MAPAASLDPGEHRREADPYFSSKLVLAELGGIRAIPGFSDALAQLFTAPLRRPLSNQQARLCRTYYRLLEIAIPTDPAHLDPALLPGALDEAVEALHPFQESPAGEELFRISHTLAYFLDCEDPQALATVPEALDWLVQFESSLHPAILRLLRRLGDVGQAIIACWAASSELALRDRLTEAHSILDEVRTQVARDRGIPEPYAAVLTIISNQWYAILAAERDALVVARLFAPLDDFYVAGPPLTPESGRLFVGRQDVFRRVEELWRNPLQKVSIVLHGQRRMGKTSILYHLEQGLGPGYVTVLADLQGILSDPLRPVRSDADLWQALAHAVARRLREAGISVRPRPDEPFEDFLDRLAPHLGDRCLVLMLDEFEKLEQKMDEGVVSRAFLEHLRYLMQHRREFLVLLAGHHTLRERLARYWGPLMGVARPESVNYLDKDSARRLITDPWDGFRLQYTKEGIRRLMETTGCQPMLLQLACSSVIRQINQRMRREGYDDYPTARLEEIEAALDQLLKAGETYYFDAVWDWLTEEQQAALEWLARAYQEGGQGWVDRQAVPDLDEGTLQALVERELLEREDDRYRFRVELLRQWVARRPLPTTQMYSSTVSSGRYDVALPAGR